MTGNDKWTVTDIEGRFAAYENVDAPADLRRRLIAAIKTIDPAAQLDATGCVLAGVLTDEYRLREINAELLAALRNATAMLDTNSEEHDALCEAEAESAASQERHPSTAYMLEWIVADARAAIARAEGTDR